MADATAAATPSPALTRENSKILEVTQPLTIPVHNKAGETVGSVTVDPKAFGGKISKILLHEAVLMYLANQRAGTASTKRRGEVAGSTKKLFRQKGTGNARAGTKRTNKRRGGGTAKGPKPRDYEYHLPKQAVKAATRQAILSKLVDGEVIILDELVMNEPATKPFATMLKSFKLGKKQLVKKLPDRTTKTVEQEVTLADTTLLLGTAGYDLNVYKSGRNIPGVKILPAQEFNAYTVLKHKKLVLTKAALEALTATAQ